MTSAITKADKELFWLKLYFDLSNGFLHAAMKRAYRDFNRTLEVMPKAENLRSSIRKRWSDVLLNKLEQMLQSQFLNQGEFDIWHQATCYAIRTVDLEYPLTQGQAQKWVNMSLKYLFLIGEERVPNISVNYQYFHVPIDSIMMDKFEIEDIPKLPGPWSKIKDYDSYFRYQSEIRRKYTGQIPMDVEFKLFNESYNKEITSN